MKKIQSILVIALGVCAMLTSCQELDTPINNIPTIETGEATEQPAPFFHSNQKMEKLIARSYIFFLPHPI